MGITKWFNEARASLGESTTLAQPAGWLTEAFGGRPSASGKSVTPETALTISAFYCGVNIKASSFASLPLQLFKRRADGGREPAERHPLYNIASRPNSLQTWYRFANMMQGHLDVRGNAYAFKIVNGLGQVLELIPLHPARVIPSVTEGGTLYYKITNGNNMDAKDVPADYILHLRGLSSDGVIGYSPVSLARESLGVALAAEEHAARIFSNGARLGGVLKHPARLSDDAAKRLRESFEAIYSGVGNAARTALLEESMSWEKVGMTSDEAQFLQSREFSVVEVARWLNMPPHMLRDLSRATFSNIEHQTIEFLTYTLLPILENWEQELNRGLLSEKDQGKYFFKFNVLGLLRGDVKTRYESYALARNWGWLCADEIRDLEQMNPIPEGKGQIYLQPLNMVPAGTDMAALRQQPTPKTEDKGDKGDKEAPKDSETVKRMSALLEQIVSEKDCKTPAVDRQKRAFERVFTDKMSQILTKEALEVRKNAQKIAKTGDISDFSDWINGFYARHREHVAKVLTPPMMAYAECRHDLTDELTEQITKETRGFADYWEQDALLEYRDILKLPPAQILPAVDALLETRASNTLKHLAEMALITVDDNPRIKRILDNGTGN